jgi:hypothetical protein
MGKKVLKIGPKLRMLVGTFKETGGGGKLVGVK